MHQEREYPARVSATELFNPDFVQLAQAYGWHGARVDRTEQFEAAFTQALQAARPTLLHLKLDTDVITTRTTLSAIRQQARQRQGA
jgi:acetolactate synthase-1/2/3 large subunit